MKERIKYCDALRLIAIISVVAIHVLAGYRDSYVQTNRFYYFILTFVDSITRMGVPIFFMITGALMLSSKKKESYAEFIKKRLPKLVIPFFLISIVYFIYEGLKNNTTISIIEFLKLFTSPGGTKYHLWFMYAIIMIYIFIPYLKVLIQNLKKKELQVLIFIIYIFGNLLYTINVYSNKQGLNLFSGFQLPDIIIYINYLFLGYYLYNQEIKTSHRKTIYIIGIICICLLPIADLLYIDNARNDSILIAKSIFAFIPSSALFILLKYNYHKITISKIVDNIVAKSAPLIFYIYMVHVLVMEKVDKIVNTIITPSRFLEKVLVIILIFAITLVISYLIAMILNYLYKLCSTKWKSIQEKRRIEMKKEAKNPPKTKVEQVLDILKDSAIFLLLAITSILLLTSILFICKVPVTPYHLPILYIISILAFLVWKRKLWKKAIIAVVIASSIFALSSLWIGNIHDSTADGNTYHKLAVGAMKNGWNPVYEDVKDFGKKEGNPFDILKDNVNEKWVDHYAKGTEIFAAVVYAFTGNIESGKVYNILWIYIGLFVLFGILKQMKLNTWKSLLVSAVMTFNPIMLVQVVNYYLDGVLTISLFIIILCCLLQQKKVTKEVKVENYLILAMAIIWCINSKFTGLGFAAVFCFILYLYHHIRNFMKEKEQFKTTLIQDTVFYIGVVILSVVVIGSSSYTRNMIDHGHPLYPLYGKGHVENMVMMEIPSSLQDENSLTIFLTSMFAKGENVSPSYSKENNQPDLKIPFTTSKEEIANYAVPDIRMAGFGPLFSGVFILAIIGTIAIIIEYIRKKNWAELLPYIITLVTIVALILLLDGSYWARYISYFYLVPIFVLIHYLQKDTKKHKLANTFALLILLILAVNSSVIAHCQRKTTKSNEEYISIRLDRFKEFVKDKKEVDIKLSHSGIQGVQYNLDDLGINNYKLTKKDNLKNDCYMFTY